MPDAELPGTATHRRAIEHLSHFQCGACAKWWAIGDAPPGRTRWHCPWCGTLSEDCSDAGPVPAA
jgi:hypothetical protein